MSLKDITFRAGRHAKTLKPRPVPFVAQSKAREEELAGEVEQVRALATGLTARLAACEARIDASLHSIDVTLQSLASQREQIRVLERELGIERPGA